MSWDGYLNDKLRKYQHKELCKRQIVAAITAYKDLRPSMQKFVHNDGREVELFTLEGTIPVNFRDSKYNIPICLFLQDRHPFLPPIIYVRPTNTMAIKSSKHVDNTGRVFMPYLAEWKHPKSDLAAVIQILCCVFAEAPPVYSKQAGHTPPQPGGFPRHYGGGYPPTTSSTPVPYPAGPHRMPAYLVRPHRMPGENEKSDHTSKQKKATAREGNDSFSVKVKESDTLNVIQSTFKPTCQNRETIQPTVVTASSTVVADSVSAQERKVKLRESIIKQLKDVKDLKDAAILTNDEFNAQKAKLVKELSEI